MAYRILSIDGGGIRGIIPATVLAELERATGQPTSDLFELVVGTSTGGIIALALTKARGDGGAEWRAEDLVPLYLEEGPKIFSLDFVRRLGSGFGLADEKYPSRNLDAALGRFLDGARLAAARTATVVTAYETRIREPFFFRSERAAVDPAYDFTIAEAARATSSAPTYFEAARVVNEATGEEWSLVDGGVYANNPAMVALVDALAAGKRPDEIFMVSLGTGELIRPLPWEQIKDWGLVGWGRRILDVVFDGIADAAHFQVKTVLGDERYHRLQTRLDRANDDLDDASPQNLEDLQTEAAELLRERAEEIALIGERLVELAP